MMSAPTLSSVSSHAADLAKVDQVRLALNGVLRGKPAVIESVLVCLLAQGHLLIEDRPGLGKTTLAKALADAVGGQFARVQCTPDLLPSDITGFSIFNQKAHEFEFRPGPVFSEVLLADEINRSTPRTQSALLEAMAERQVTVDGLRHALAPQFFVIATQNPHEQHGTYPLPEAQLDRFAMKLSVGYPEPEDESEMLAAAVKTDKDDGPRSVILAPGQLVRMQQSVRRLNVDRSVQDYLVRLAQATRQHPHISLGISPRGLLTWQRAAQAQAFLRSRDFVTPDDIQDVAFPVLSVRLGIEREHPASIIQELIRSISVP